MDLQSLSELSDADVLTRVQRLAQSERRATAALIAHLIEVENRKLYLAQACSSLFTYCVRVLHYSEPAAYNRILAARAARAFPAVLAHLERGDVHLAAVRLLAPALTAGNHAELLAAAAHKSKREGTRRTSSPTTGRARGGSQTAGYGAPHFVAAHTGAI